MMQLRLREARPTRQHSAKVHTAFRIRVGLLTLYMLTAALCVFLSLSLDADTHNVVTVVMLQG